MRIINVASSDNFEDILEAVKESESVRVILVVPKSSRVFKSKIRVEQLKSHFEKLGKDVSVISSGAEVVKNANLAGFNILREAPGSAAKKDDDLISLYSEPFEEPAKRLLPSGSADKKSLKKFSLIFLGAAVASFALIVLVSISGAKIRIVPAKIDFSISIPAVISDKVTQVDAVYGVIPGEIVELEKVLSKTFTSSGEKDVFQKANGRITIYNNFSTSSQMLVATTRFQTLEGLVFRIPRAVTVPGAVKAGNNLEPGRIEVEVVADRAGEEYNIGPSEFKIPGFLGSPKYQGFYAESFEKFSGGFIGRSRFVTKEDMEGAGGLVKSELINEVKAEFASLGDFKILDEILAVEIEETADSNSTGDLVSEFKISLKAKVKTLAFKEKDVTDFISQYIKNSRNLKVAEKDLKISYAELSYNEEKSELSLKLNSSGQTIENIDKDMIISGVFGKNSDEIKSYLSGLKEVESAQIFLSPFWRRTVPKDKNKVKVEVVDF